MIFNDFMYQVKFKMTMMDTTSFSYYVSYRETTFNILIIFSLIVVMLHC